MAKTSFGKSLIMQVLPLLVPQSIILTVMPLFALPRFRTRGEDSTSGPLCKTNINRNNVNSGGLLREIQQGRYTHVLSSPELFHWWAI